MAKKKKKKLTKMQAAYQKELKRIQRYIRRKEREGFQFSEALSVPQMPKRVTQKALKKIQEMTGWKIRKLILPTLNEIVLPFVDQVTPTPPEPEPVTPVVVSTTPLTANEEFESAWANFMDQVKEIPVRQQDRVLDLLREYRNRIDEDDLAEALYNFPRRLSDFVVPGTSNWDMEAFNTEFMDALPGVTQGMKQDMEDVAATIITGEYYL